MKKIVLLSCVASCLLWGGDEVKDLGTIKIYEKINSKIVQDVSSEQIKNADISDTLNTNISSISMVRRSAISNDIILRGQKKDNINVLIDEAKIYGACPNRMDPPVSHVLANNIENVSVIEGPYDVENFGTLSGKVLIKTKEPTKELKASIDAGIGSFHSYKGGAMVSGGNDYFKLLVSASTEQGDEYKDGNGDDFLAQQIKKSMPKGGQYAHNNLKAYEKKTLLTKGVINFTEDFLLRFSYTANRSDNVLYPNTPMDADYDNSDIYTIGVDLKNLGSFSKKLSFDYFNSKVDHPMSTKLRNSGAKKYKTNHMHSSIWGAKIKNDMDIYDTSITFGLDTSIRNWKGRMYSTDVKTGEQTPLSTSLSSTDTKNRALFFHTERDFGNLNLSFGTRYDYTDIQSASPAKTDRTYKSLNANLFAIYSLNENFKLFGGFGKSSRVPDARELYYGKSNNNLEDTKNYETDFGIDMNLGSFSMRTKFFYSKLKDYIYNVNGAKFTNIDATIYGVNIDGSYYITDNIYIDYALNYQRGKKDDLIQGQNDDDLAEIPPLKGLISLNYEKGNTTLSTQVVAVDKWHHYDSANGEQSLGGYALVNLKASLSLFKNLTLSIGVDNIFDKTYTSTNTYKDIRYLESGGERILLNDTGRFAYANIKYEF